MDLWKLKKGSDFMGSCKGCYYYNAKFNMCAMCDDYDFYTDEEFVLEKKCEVEND